MVRAMPHMPLGLCRLLDQAAHRGVNIINISQCITGMCGYGEDGAGFQLKIAHVVSGYDSTVEAAVTKLMYLQGKISYNRMVREKRNRHWQEKSRCRNEEGGMRNDK